MVLNWLARKQTAKKSSAGAQEAAKQAANVYKTLSNEDKFRFFQQWKEHKDPRGPECMLMPTHTLDASCASPQLRLLS